MNDLEETNAQPIPHDKLGLDLHEIILNYYRILHGAAIESGDNFSDAVMDFTEEIKQAFKEAGWLEPGIANINGIPLATPEGRAVEAAVHNGRIMLITPLEHHRSQEEILHKLPVIMTGQEWYDRFEVCLPKEVLMPDGTLGYYKSDLLKATQEAAGLEE